MDVLDTNIKAGKDIIELIKSAVRDNDVQAVEDLLEGLGDLSSLLNKVSEIWDLAVEYGRAEALEELLRNLEFKKNINVKNSEGLTPLMEAAKLDNASAVRKLLAAGAEYEISSEFCSKKTALYYAIENGKARALKVFINNKPISPAILVDLLKFAVFRNNVNAVKVLLEAGTDITTQTAGNPYEWDGTVLHMVASWDKIEVLELLLKHKDIEQVLNLPDDENGFTPLMRAVRKGHTDTVSKLIDAGADITIQVTGNPDGWNGATAMHIAAEVSIIEVLELLLGHWDIKKILDLPGGDGYTALMGAAIRGRKDAVSKLIEAGADIRIQITGNPDGWDGATALYLAAFSNRIEVLELLLKHEDIKKILNLPKRNGYTALMCAAFRGHADVVSKLIDAGAGISIQITGNLNQWDGATALYLAAFCNKIEVLELLLKHEDIKKILNLRKQNGYTPLMGAAWKGHAEIVSKLIDAGADIKIQVTGNSNGWDGATALYIAATFNKIEVLELFLEHNDVEQVLNLPNREGVTPLMCAAFRGHEDAVSKLIDAGADITTQVTGNSNGWDGAIALHIAAEENKIEVLELLLKHKNTEKVLNLLDKDGYTPLIHAAFRDHEDAVSKLIDAGADITIQVTGNSNGWDGAIALHIAAEENKIEVLELFLKHKNIEKVLNLPDKDGYTPLMGAAFNGHEDAVSKLIDAGADITTQVTGNSNGWDGAIALHIAAEENKIEVLELLLKHKNTEKVLNLPDKDGYTPLMRAVFNGREDAVNKLIDAGADIKIQVTGNSNGWDGATALYIAATFNKIEVLELFLKHNDVEKVLNLPRQNGYTPLMRAASKGHEDAVSKLIDAGADIKIQVTGNSNGWDGATALYIAATFNKIEVLELFLKHNDVEKVLNFPRQNGFTPLMRAASKGHEEAVSKLIDAGADIAAQNQEKNTAAHLAAEYGKAKSLGILIVKAPRVLDIPNGNGHTPKDLLNNRQKRSSSEASIFSDGVKEDGEQKKELYTIF